LNVISSEINSINSSNNRTESSNSLLSSVNNSNNIKFLTKDYSVGQEVYYLTEYSKEDFDKVLRDPQIPEDFKERFYNVEFDSENNFILRPHVRDQKEFLEQFTSNSNANFLSQQQSELMIKMFKNAKYKYLPKCEAFVSKENLGKSSNMYLNRKYVFENGISDKKLIYKLRKIQKYSLCKIVGIGVANCIVLKDLFLGKVFAVNNLALLTRKEQVPAVGKISILNNNSSNNNNNDNNEYKNNNKNSTANISKISSPTTSNLIEDFELAESFYFKHIHCKHQNAN